jgi:antitoxin (DNA-binding transcriptional repressor) of toxin-antitoxin stability system
MLTSTISETKNHLSKLLERVQNGETLVILDRRKPVARVERISPITSSPHLAPPKSAGAPTDALSLPIGGRKGKSTGALASLLEERAGGL